MNNPYQQAVAEAEPPREGSGEYRSAVDLARMTEIAFFAYSGATALLVLATGHMDAFVRLELTADRPVVSALRALQFLGIGWACVSYVLLVSRLFANLRWLRVGDFPITRNRFLVYHLLPCVSPLLVAPFWSNLWRASTPRYRDWRSAPSSRLVILWWIGTVVPGLASLVSWLLMPPLMLLTSWLGMHCMMRVAELQDEKREFLRLRREKRRRRRKRSSAE